MEKVNQILNFEIRTFYRYIDLYRTYFLDTLTFQDFFYTTFIIESFTIMQKILYL